MNQARFRVGVAALAVAAVGVIAGSANGEEVSCVEGTPIPFSAAASDLEDGDLSAQITWTSDLDGVIGTGSSFSALLSPGRHVITASVTDGGGKTGLAELVINVKPATEPLLSLDLPAPGGEVHHDSLEGEAALASIAETAFKGELDLAKDEWNLLSASLSVARIRYAGTETVTLIMREWEGKLPKRLEGEIAFLDVGGEVLSRHSAAARKAKCEPGSQEEEQKEEQKKNPCFTLSFDLPDELAPAGGVATLKARPVGRHLRARRWVITSSFSK